MMKKTTWSFIVDFIAFVLGGFLISSGLVMHYILLPRSGRFMTVWGLNRHEWGDWHFKIAVVLLIVLSFHLFLHWRWIVSMIKGTNPQTSGYRLLIGVLSLIALIVLMLLPVFSSIQVS